MRLVRLRGSYTQTDPIGIAGGLNTYGYANGDPVNFSDPFGLDPDPLGAIRRQAGLRQVIRMVQTALSSTGQAVADDVGSLVNETVEQIATRAAEQVDDATQLE